MHPTPIYLDANSTTPLCAEAYACMRPWLEGRFGNASSTHQAGQAARAALDEARDEVAALLGAQAREIIFTAGGTESDNLALFGVLAPGDRLVTTRAEHHAVLHAAEALERAGVEVTWLAPDTRGLIDPEALTAALEKPARLVSILYANNETGVVQPLPELARRAHAAGALFHTDAVQAAGKLPLALASELAEVDLLSLSGHKLYGPQGTGALFVRRGVALRPMLHGGPHERARRAGTENVAGLVGLGAAARVAGAWLADGGAARLQAQRDRLEARLLLLPGAAVNGAGAARVCNTLNLRFSGVRAESLLIALDLQGVAVSAGSACQSGALEPSHVLLAMGLDDRQARASVRLSLLRDLPDAELERAGTSIAAAVERLRSRPGA